MRINTMKRDSAALADGVWQAPGEEYPGVKFKVRPLDDFGYVDMRGAAQRRAARVYGGDTSKIPAEVTSAIVADAVLARILVDVEGLEDESGAPIKMDRIEGFLRNPDYAVWLSAVIQASAMAGAARADDIKDAVGN